VEGACRRDTPNALQNLLPIRQNITRRNPQDSYALLAKPRFAALVMTDLVRIIMPPAVDFDAQREIAAEEVEDVRADRMLSAKPEAAQSASPQGTPEQPLGQRQTTPQGAGARDREGWRFHWGKVCPDLERVSPLHRFAVPLPLRGRNG